MDWEDFFKALDKIIEESESKIHVVSVEEPSEMLLSQIQEDQAEDAKDYGSQTRDFFINMYLKGLAEEVGEVAGVLKRIDRGDYAWYSERAFRRMCSEIGDVLWYLAGLATVHGLSFEEIWKYNRDKLAYREREGTIKGGHRDE